MLPFWFFHTVIVLTSDLASLAALVAKTINIERAKEKDVGTGTSSGVDGMRN